MSMSPREISGAVRSLCGDRRGSSAVEFAMILPAFVILLFGIMEFGRLLWTQNALHYAVEEAARCYTVATATCSDATHAKSFAASRSGLTFSNSTFTISSPSCGNQVSASYPFTLLVPYLQRTITLTAQSCYPT